MTVNSLGVIGAGIVGLATAKALTEKLGVPVTVLEKEQSVAVHQTGRNSGVVHAGLYYRPGSLKATLCREGVGLLRSYCESHGLAYDALGKVVVATSEQEVPRLEEIGARAHANGVPGIRRLDPAQLAAIEPHVRGVAALHSPETAVVDYRQVANSLATDVAELGGEVRLGQQVVQISTTPDAVVVRT
ncbi:MAG: FAD-dependent oxidoreductase, partial [Nocardioidaceae bacterium]